MLIWGEQRSEVYRKLAENCGYTYAQIADMTHVQWRSVLGLDKEDSKTVTFANEKERVAWMQKQALKRFKEKQSRG